jgi:hypothetical protein
VTILHTSVLNECADDNPCHQNATCVNLIGSHSCACNEGFTGDGYNCEGTVYNLFVSSQVIYCFKHDIFPRWTIIAEFIYDIMIILLSPMIGTNI